VCKQLGVSLTVVPFQREYWDRVVSYTVESVKNGLTPNPDMMCNARVKFGAFYEYLLREGKRYDKIATGHYADTEVKEGITYLKTSPDPIKDQTYFLSQLSQEQLQKALFPIGKYPKERVRELAQAFGLPNALRKDSQGICFLGKIPFDEFIKHHLGIKKGEIREENTNKTLGQHEGFWYYTIGQRQGIRLSGGPWYVSSKDTKKNIVYITHGDEYQSVARDSFEIKDLHWISGVPPQKTQLQVKVRHGEKKYDCSLFKQDNDYMVTLGEKDQGLAAGQFAVFYDGEYCLGGGVITC
jgi:tRNA-specific 2-thiouridylase